MHTYHDFSSAAKYTLTKTRLLEKLYTFESKRYPHHGGPLPAGESDMKAQLSSGPVHVLEE